MASPRPIPALSRALGPALLLAAALGGAPAAFADHVVADCVPAHLQAAIRAANQDNGTVQLAAGCVYTFLVPVDYNASLAYENAVVDVLTGHYTIEGNGATLERYRPPSGPDNTAHFRFFFVEVGAVITIKNLKMDRGRALDGPNGSSPSCGESAGTGGGGSHGGAIFNMGDLTLDHVTITNSRAGNGGTGGPCLNGSLFCVSHGGGWGGPGGSGGGVYNYGTLTVKDSVLAHNVAGNGGSGGGGCTQTGIGGGGGNTGGNGGAVFGDSSTGHVSSTTVQDSTVFDNQAGNGGNGGVGGTADVGPGGEAGSGGGLASFGTLTVLQSTVEKNTAGQGGYSYARREHQGESNGSTSPAGNAGRGGGVGAFGPSLTIQGSTFTNNAAGLSNIGGSGGHQAVHSAVGRGGGVYTRASSAVVENSTISGNLGSRPSCMQIGQTIDVVKFTLPGGNGGGLVVDAGAATLKNVTMTDNVPGALAQCETDAGYGAYFPAPQPGTGGGLFYAGFSFVSLYNTVISTPVWKARAWDTSDGTPDACAREGILSLFLNWTPDYNIVWSELSGADSTLRFGCPSFTVADPKLGTLTASTGDGRNPSLGAEMLKPQPGSPLVTQAGPGGFQSCFVTLDQRGATRPQGPNCDIGAYETRFRLLTSPSNATVNEGATVTFTADADTEGFVQPTVQWQRTTDYGATWSSIGGANAISLQGDGTYRSSYSRQVGGADHLTRYRAVFSSIVGGATTEEAFLGVRYMAITQDIVDVTVNAGSIFQLLFAWDAYPQVDRLIWRRRANAFAAWEEFQNYQLNLYGGGSNYTDTATAAMNGWQYQFLLKSTYSGLPDKLSAIATLHVTNNATSPSFSSNYPENAIATEGDNNDRATFVAFVSGNPLPTVGWQSPVQGAWTDLTSGNPVTDPDAYVFQTTPGQNNSVFLSFRAWGDQDQKQFRATAHNSSGNAGSRQATLFVQVPTQPTLDCPSPVLYGTTYECTLTVTAVPQRGPRPRKPCGEAMIRTQSAERRCLLDGNGKCTVSFVAPGQGWTSMSHQVIYFGGDQPCEGGIAPPDQGSQTSLEVSFASCVRPRFTSCPAAQTVDGDPVSCKGSVPDFLTTEAGLGLADAGCPVTLSQSPAELTQLGPGTHTVVITAETTVGQVTCNTSVTVRDTTLPEISVTGDNPLHASCKQPVNLLAGVTASDLCDPSPRVLMEGTFDFQKSGTYTLRYKARDAAGNESGYVERTLIVDDTVAPELTMNGPETFPVECHGTYQELGAFALDACDGVVGVDILGTVDVNTPGTYTLIYEAKDKAGNIGRAKREVVVEDTEPPTAQLNGSPLITLDCGAPFTDPGVDASDACAGTNVRVAVDGSVNVNVPGDYVLSYKVSDPSGNTLLAPLQRHVVVSGGGTPDITVLGANPATVECHTGYTDPGATAKDACGRPVAVTPSGTVDVNSPGSYTITYSATAGSTANATRTVKVVDTIKPTLALNDPTPITLECHRDSYVERGATATDTCAGSFAATASGSVNVNAPGTYTITYGAKDPSGNTADSITRTVSVVDTTAPALSCPGNQTVIAVPGSCAAVATYAATASDLCGGSTPVLFDPVSGSTFPVGVTTVTATSTDAYSNKTTCTFTVTVLAAPTSVALSLSNPTQQYSDGETLTATVTNAVTNAPVSGGSVTFKIGGSTVGTSNVGAGGVATLSLNLVESAVLAKADLSPGPHTVTATYNGNAALCYAASPAAGQTLTIGQENARAAYTGSVYSGTSCATCGSAVVTLSATIWDITATPDASGDAAPGDIRNATLTFLKVDGVTETPIATVNVGLVTAGDLKIGAATYNWNVDIGASDSEPFTIGIRVNNYYTRSSAADYTVVTVSKPIGTNFITGGGYLVLTNPAGLKPGDPGSKTNFGFNVKYNKQGTNLQGRINAILRRQETDGIVHVYQIKGNAMTSLTVDAKGGTAVFNGKANITDITNPLAPLTVDGNGTLTVTMTDKGEPGSADTIGIALFNKAGGLWFSSSFGNGKTLEKLLGGGNVVVR